MLVLFLSIKILFHFNPKNVILIFDILLYDWVVDVKDAATSRHVGVIFIYKDNFPFQPKKYHFNFWYSPIWFGGWCEDAACNYHSSPKHIKNYNKKLPWSIEYHWMQYRDYVILVVSDERASSRLHLWGGLSAIHQSSEWRTWPNLQWN